MGSPRSSPRNRNPAKQRNHFGLTMAAGLFQHAAQLAADRVKRNTSNGGNFLDRFSGGETARHASFRGSQIEQRLDQFDGVFISIGRWSQSRYGTKIHRFDDPARSMFQQGTSHGATSKAK
jgi:hypothetical protein